jgi:hypothetical protein
VNAIVTFPSVGKLVLLLSSDQPGEIVAAASAIDRTLRVAGFDWFDLVKAIDKQERWLRAIYLGLGGRP